MKKDDYLTTKSAMDLMIRMALILYLCHLSLTVFAPFALRPSPFALRPSPFALLMLWVLIIAIVLFPLQQKLAVKMDGTQGKSAAVIVLSTEFVGG